MTEFSEGMRWTVYGNDGFTEKASMTFENDDGETLASVIRFGKSFVALSLITGDVLSNFEEIHDAVSIAETEALRLTNL